MDIHFYVFCKIIIGIFYCFQEANCDKCVPVIFSGIDGKYCQSLPNAGRGFDWPRFVFYSCTVSIFKKSFQLKNGVIFRVVLRLYPKVGYIELEEEEEEKLDINVSGPMFQSIIQTPKETSPFSSKIIMRESNTTHTKKTSSESSYRNILSYCLCFLRVIQKFTYACVFRRWRRNNFTWH